jgi:Skp family chaperone for outer membrane proteins
MQRFAIVAVLAVTCLFAGAAQAQEIKIAVARAARIANEMQEMKDFRQKMANDQQALQAQLKERQEKLRLMRDNRDQLKRDSPQYNERNKELLEEAINLEAWGRIRQAELERNIKLNIKGFWDKIEAAVAEVAQAKGIDIVISDQRPEIPDDLDQIKIEQLQQLIGQRDVLYANPKVDISDEVIALLDKKYKEGK